MLLLAGVVYWVELTLAYHCNYSFWYCPPMLLLAGVVYWVELTLAYHSKYSF